MNSFKYILFDLDGTLTDPKIGITKSYAYALSHFGIETSDLDSLCGLIGPPLRDNFMKLYGFSEQQTELAVKIYREYFSDKGIYENTVYEGIGQLVCDLTKAGKKLIVATSKPAVYAEKILEHFDLRHYFDFVSGCELSGERSEKDEVIKYALEKQNITDLSQLVMIGDRKYDIIGAKKLGIVSIGVLYGFGTRQELECAGADFIAETVGDIAKMLL